MILFKRNILWRCLIKREHLRASGPWIVLRIIRSQVRDKSSRWFLFSRVSDTCCWRWYISSEINKGAWKLVGCKKRCLIKRLNWTYWRLWLSMCRAKLYLHGSSSRFINGIWNEVNFVNIENLHKVYKVLSHLVLPVQNFTWLFGASIMNTVPMMIMRKQLHNAVGKLSWCGEMKNAFVCEWLDFSFGGRSHWSSEFESK